MLLGGTAMWPVGASAQQPAMPVIGFLDPDRPKRSGSTARIAARPEGDRLSRGECPGGNRFADNKENRLPELAADLAQRKVAHLVTSARRRRVWPRPEHDSPGLFLVSDDPVRLGLVASFRGPAVT